MVIRTVSQLPKLSKGNLKDSVENSFIGVSYGVQKDGGYTYVSNKATVADFIDTTEDIISAKLANDYGLKDDDGNSISVNLQKKRIDSLYAGDIEIDGIKQYKYFPWISSDFPTNVDNYGGYVDNIIPNVGKVRELVKSSPAFVSTTSSYVADGDPFKTASGNNLYDAEMINYDNTIGLNDDKFYCWSIEDGNTDSSQTQSTTGTSTAQYEYQEMRDDGQLVVWGWLADNGQVDPEQAWVGIFGKMKFEGDDYSMANMPVQIQPWIRGSNASKLQYVGFNVLVKKGLQLKIKTGFGVNGNGGAYQNPGSMTFRDRFLPNTFFGYIIKN